jgi:hypothetical protein
LRRIGVFEPSELRLCLAQQRHGRREFRGQEAAGAGQLQRTCERGMVGGGVPPAQLQRLGQRRGRQRTAIGAVVDTPDLLQARGHLQWLAGAHAQRQAVLRQLQRLGVQPELGVDLGHGVLQLGADCGRSLQLVRDAQRSAVEHFAGRDRIAACLARVRHLEQRHQEIGDFTRDGGFRQGALPGGARTHETHRRGHRRAHECHRHQRGDAHRHAIAAHEA